MVLWNFLKTEKIEPRANEIKCVKTEKRMFSSYFLVCRFLSKFCVYITQYNC